MHLPNTYRTYRLFIIYNPFRKYAHKYSKHCVYKQSVIRFPVRRNTYKTLSKINNPEIAFYRKSHSRNHYKPYPISIVSKPLTQNDSGNYHKSITFPTKSWSRFGTLQIIKNRYWNKVLKHPGKWIKYLIKPVDYWYFWGPFRKKASKSIKKALG